MRPQNPKKSKSKSRLGSLFANGSQSGLESADWTSADGKLVVAVIGKIGSLGGAIRFGYTRDGGAYSVGLYLDDDSETFYFPPGQDINENLQAFLQKLETLEE